METTLSSDRPLPLIERYFSTFKLFGDSDDKVVWVAATPWGFHYHWCETYCGLGSDFFSDIALTIDHQSERFLTQRNGTSNARLCIAGEYESFGDDRCAVAFSESFQRTTENGEPIEVVVSYDIQVEGTDMLARASSTAAAR